MQDDHEEGDGEYTLLYFGWRDRLPRLPRPVVAGFGKRLWVARFHGTGFKVESLAGGAALVLVGFYTTTFVSAATHREAEAKARAVTAERWRRSAPGRLSSGSLTLELDELAPLAQRFRWRSGGGYTFYAATPDD